MISLELKRYNVDSKLILKDLSNQRLLGSLIKFARLLEGLGYPVQAYSEAALQSLSGLPLEKKEQITNNFENWSQWIEPLDPRRSYDNELMILKRALDRHALIADQEFLKTIEKGQIIEFYGENMIQLYRSFNFFHLTGYSLLDLSVFEWYVLWDRPSRVLKSVSDELNEALENFIPAKRFKTPRHVIREICNTSQADPFTPRAALGEFLYLGSLRSSSFVRNPQKGFICSSFGELLAVGTVAETIQFL